MKFAALHLVSVGDFIPDVFLTDVYVAAAAE